MAQTREISTDLEILIAKILNLNLKSHQRRISALRDQTFKKLKSRQTSAVNQFDVKRHCEGLQEKFVILNRDDLAEALAERLDSLSRLQHNLEPEFLTLLLHLSDHPASFSKIEDLEALKEVDIPPQITWKEIIKDDPLDETGVWDYIDHAAGSDDESSVGSEIEKNLNLDTQKPKDATVELENSKFTLIEGDADGLRALQKEQFWRPQVLIEDPNDEQISKDSEAENGSVLLTETQAIRECLLMLQGFPTALFNDQSSTRRIGVDPKFYISHISNGRLQAIFEAYAETGFELVSLRNCIRRDESVPLMQAFYSGVTTRLRDLNDFFGDWEARIIHSRDDLVISLTAVYQEVTRRSRCLLDLSVVFHDFFEKSKGSAQSYMCLDILYDAVCLREAVLDEEGYNFWTKLFDECLKFYLDSVRQWMQDGGLSSQHNILFIEEYQDDEARGKVLLWRDRFKLKMFPEGQVLAPKFIRPFVGAVFATGNSILFLDRLGLKPSKSSRDDSSDTILQFKLRAFDSENLIPFSSILQEALKNEIQKLHQSTSVILRKALTESCNLWENFDALEHLYLFKDGTTAKQFALTVFSKMDHGRVGWNDSYLLTDWARVNFNRIPFISTDNITVLSLPGAYGDPLSRRRTVKVLEKMLLQYDLPWAVSNIIQPPSIACLQKISIFLLQMLRSKHVLERLRLLKEDIHSPEDQNELCTYFKTRQKLLWFSNTLYSHVTEQVFEPSCRKMKAQQAKAADFDAMVSIYDDFIQNLETRCFLSSNLAPIRQAIISILDLSIYFTDVHNSYSTMQAFDLTNRSLSLHSSRMYSDVYRKRNRNSAEDDSSDEDTDISDDDIDTSYISFAESPYLAHLKKIDGQFDQLHGFVLAGIRGINHVSADTTWETLSKSLEWKKT